ncbi:YihY/virulence factor BrkB family protein [Peptacetobacter sp.]|uniref:YihY/virulence factor BrkB family protein n=1 Tax=Peptacetobacter sp. TaxID=2991975 RepID=UPI0026334734|nr:YihY/virulence factor BrkB family protein [Peptacetobacter sp.]
MIIDRNKLNHLFAKLNYSRLSSKSAEVAFFLTMSIFPFLMFTVSIVAYVPILQITKYMAMLEKVIPVKAIGFVDLVVKSAVDKRNTHYMIVSFCLTMWTFSRAVKALIKGMNTSFYSPETRSFMKVMMISMIFTLMLLILIFSTMTLLVYGEKIGIVIFKFLGFDEVFLNLWNITRYGAGTISTIIVFTLLYKYTPNIKLSTKMVAPGAVFATFGWFLMSYLYSYYTNHFSNYSAIYGSFREIIVLLTWLYFSSWVIVIGYEINARLYRRRKRRLEVIPE